jgi:hypothetical protein
VLLFSRFAASPALRCGGGTKAEARPWRLAY